VITDKRSLDSTGDEQMMLSIHPGSTLDDVVGTISFAQLSAACADHRAADKGPVRLIRGGIDPQRMYMG
jgi:hypothetical protein